MRLNVPQRFLGVLVTAALTASPAVAQTYTWVGPSGNIWQSPSAWSPNGVPGAANDVIFTDAGAGTVLLQSSAGAHSLTFNTTTGSYGLFCTVPNNQTFFGLTAINVAATDTAAQNINLIGAINGTLAFPGSGPGALTITNNSASFPAPSLIISSRGIGTTGDSTAGLTFAGVGYTNFNTPFIGAGGSSSPVTGGLTKTGTGILAMTSNAASLSGTVTLAGGTLLLDYSTDSSNKLGTGNNSGPGLDLSGGVLTLRNAGANSVLQNVGTGATSLDTAHNVISNAVSNGPSTVLYLGMVTRAAPGTLDVNVVNPFVIQAANGLSNGLLGGWATTGSGTSWATAQSGTIVPLTAYGTNQFAPGTNTDVTGNSNVNGVTTNSLRFNTPGVTVNAGSAGLELQSGGILVTNAGSGATISGALYTDVGEMIVHAYGDVTFLSTSIINANNGLTKTGGGTLTLTGQFSGPSGPINVNQGSLRLTATGSTLGFTPIHFNDAQGLNQALYIQLPDGASRSLVAPISTRAGLSFINQAQDSRITLPDVISSATPVATPINFSSYNQSTILNSSGFTLTGNNTFTGNVTLNSGFLGINSNAALGNAANSLTLQVNSATDGGLELLSDGINIARPVTFTSPTRVLNYGTNVDTISGVVSGGGVLVKDGIGTLVLTGTNTNTGGVQINAGTLRVTNAVNLGAGGNVTIAGGTLSGAGGGALNFPNIVSFILGPPNAVGTGAIALDYAASMTVPGLITDNAAGVGALLKTGAGSLTLANTSNTYSGGTSVQQGRLFVAGDGALGAAAGQVTIGALGTLYYLNSDTTNRTFNMQGGTLAVSPAQTLTLSGAAVGGGYLTGAFVVTGNNGLPSQLIGITTPPATTISSTGTTISFYQNFTNGGSLTVTPGGAAALQQFTNEGSGSLTLNGGSIYNAATTISFQSYGTLTLNPNTTASPTQLVNVGNAPLYFNGGSRTFISIPANAGQFDAGIDLHGQNAVVAGGLFVNNGYVVDSSGAGTKTVIADFGSLVKGAGFFQNSVQTIDGGKFQSGNSPGQASFGSFTFGPGGVSNYVFAIDDAAGTAGPSPDANGQVSGWGLVKTVQRQVGAATTPGDFTWTATPANKLTFALETLINPTTVGADVAGPMADFDPTRPYSWLAASWAGNYTGPTDGAALDASTVFDTRAFQNPMEGIFGWTLDSGGHMLSLTYTPGAVPEPGTLGLMALAGVGLGVWARRARRREPSPSRLRAYISPHRHEVG